MLHVTIFLSMKSSIAPDLKSLRICIAAFLRTLLRQLAEKAEADGFLGFQLCHNWFQNLCVSSW